MSIEVRGGDSVTIIGQQGPEGVAGKSAYEVWLDAGNDGSVDDFLMALKPQVAGAWQTGRYFGAGDHDLSETIKLPYYGGRVYGNFQSDWDIKAGDQRYQHPDSTRIFWRGNAADPAIEITGEHSELRDFTLAGLTPEGKDAERPQIGVLMTKRKGIGTGKARLERITVAGFERAIVFGSQTGDNNCDTTVADQVWVRDCNIAVDVTNYMAMGLRLGIEAINVNRVLNWRHGGHFTLHGGLMTTRGKWPAIVEMDSETGQRPPGPGSGSGRVECHNFKIDAQCNRELAWWRNISDPSRYNGVYFRDVQEGKRKGEEREPGIHTQVDTRGRSQVVIENSRFLRPGSIRALPDDKGNLPNIVLRDNALFTANPLRLFTEDSRFNADIYGCVAWDNSPLQNGPVIVRDGEVVSNPALIVHGTSSFGGGWQWSEPDDDEA